MADNKLYDILGVDRNASEAEIKKVIISFDAASVIECLSFLEVP